MTRVIRCAATVPLLTGNHQVCQQHTHKHAFLPPLCCRESIFTVTLSLSLSLSLAAPVAAAAAAAAVPLIVAAAGVVV